MADLHTPAAGPRPVAEHEVRCLICKSAHVAGNLNADDIWYGYCVTCGVRFWDDGATRPPGAVL